MAARKKKKRTQEETGQDIVSALTTVAKEKNISMDIVLECLESALQSGAKKQLNRDINVGVRIDHNQGTISAYTYQLVVEEVEEPDAELSLEEAREVDPDAEIGDEVIEEENLDIFTFGRSAIYTAKQMIMQRMKGFEAAKIFEDYKDRVGEIITGTVQKIENGNILLNIGRTEALLPKSEQIKKERYHQGNPVKCAIIDVREDIKAPQVIVSRTSPMFLNKLFETEVPEIHEGIVRIVRIVRAAGYRAKVAVISNDSRVDPVGACIGMRGNRIQTIVRELSNEKMDIINWSSDFELLVRRTFSPADVRSVTPVSDSKVVIIVREDDLAQAIGKDGQNIRLSSKLLERDLDIYGDQEFESMSEEERLEIMTPEEGDDDSEDGDGIFRDEDEYEESPFSEAETGGDNEIQVNPQNPDDNDKPGISE